MNEVCRILTENASPGPSAICISELPPRFEGTFSSVAWSPWISYRQFFPEAVGRHGENATVTKHGFGSFRAFDPPIAWLTDHRFRDPALCAKLLRSLVGAS